MLGSSSSFSVMIEDDQYYIVDRQHSHLLDDSIVMTDGGAGAGAGDYTLVYEGSWENQLCVVVSFFYT